MMLRKKQHLSKLMLKMTQTIQVRWTCVIQAWPVLQQRQKKNEILFSFAPALPSLERVVWYYFIILWKASWWCTLIHRSNMQSRNGQVVFIFLNKSFTYLLRRTCYWTRGLDVNKGNEDCVAAISSGDGFRLCLEWHHVLHKEWLGGESVASFCSALFPSPKESFFVLLEWCFFFFSFPCNSKRNNV